MVLSPYFGWHENSYINNINDVDASEYESHRTLVSFTVRRPSQQLASELKSNILVKENVLSSVK